MKVKITLAVVLLGAATGAFAQSDQAYIDKATLAAPNAQLKAAAMVIRFKADFTYDVVRPGANATALVCYDKSGIPGQQPVSVECTNQGNLKRAVQNIKYEALGDKAKSEAGLDALEKDGTREKPVFGSVWYHFRGADTQHGNTHMTIAVPGATAASLGLPDKGGSGGVWIMNAGTSTAHLMTPGE
jgi:hypothetical protein